MVPVQRAESQGLAVYVALWCCCRSIPRILTAPGYSLGPSRYRLDWQPGGMPEGCSRHWARLSLLALLATWRAGGRPSEP